MSKAGFQSVMHLWSTKRTVQPHVIQHPGIHIYHEKVSAFKVDDQYCDVKRKYIEGRGLPWNHSNKRPERLRDSLNELEELLEYKHVAAVQWKNTRYLQMILSNGCVISIVVAVDSPDIEKLFIDKFLISKISDCVYDGIIGELYMIFSFLERSELMLVNYTKKPFEKREGEKLGFYEPKISFINLPGPSGKKVKRHCLKNITAEWLCVWWSITGDEAWSLSPIASEADRANLVMLTITGISSVTTIDVAAFTRTNGDLIDVVFSNKHHNRILTIEQSQTSSAKFLLNSCVYEVNESKIKKMEAVTIPTKACVTYQSRNYFQNKVVLYCANGTLVLYDECKRVAKTIKPSFNLVQISWHPGDMIFLVCSVKGDLQIFDIALNCLTLQLISDEMISTSNYLRLNQYFFTQPKLKKVFWAEDSGLGNSPDAVPCSDDLLLVFERGPIGMLRLELGVSTHGAISPLELINEYIRNEQLSEAVAFLNALDWNTNGRTCFQCLVLITDYIFRRPFNSHHEVCLENTLGSFYAPVIPLTENVILQFRDDVSRLARRFFHHLLRHRRFEKAYLLAVDIASKDLFMDIHYLALDIENMELAEASKNRAMQIHYAEQQEAAQGGGPQLLPDIFDQLYPYEINREMNNLNLRRSPTDVRRETNSGHVQSLRQPSFEEVVRFEFEDSDEEFLEQEDPVAWALASRSGNLSIEKEKKNQPEDLQLVHFGNV